MLTRYKEKVQSMLEVEAGYLHEKGLTPNHLSLIGVSMALLSACFYLLWRLNPIFLVTAPISLLMSGFFDALDGVMARFYGKVTVFGGFLDSLLDRYADSIVIIAIVISALCNVFWGLTALVGSMLVSYTRAKADAFGVKMESVGLFERAERILLIVIASFASLFWLNALNWSMIALAVLSNLTVLQRIIHFRSQVSRLQHRSKS